MFNREEKIEVKSELSEEVLLSTNVDDFRCPISLEVMLVEPMITTPCGHLFEKEFIKQCKGNCPKCNKKFEALFEAPSFFKNQLYQFIKKYPEYLSESHVTMQQIQGYLNSDDNPHVLKRAIFYYMRAGKLNAISTEEGYKGGTLVGLLAQSETGRNFLKNPNIAREITEQGLNAVFEDGTEQGCSTVTWLSASRAGIAILVNFKLSGKVNSVGLNTIEQTGNYQGYSAVTHLTLLAEGRNFLKTDAGLRGKINESGLNTKVLKGSHKGFTSVMWFVGTSDGLKILKDDIALRGKITTPGLNSIRQKGEYKGRSGTYLLVSRLEGIALLSEDPVLCGKINAKGLNAIYQGFSAVHRLTAKPEGRALLKKYPDLRNLISSKALRHSVYDADLGIMISPAEWLQSCEDGKELLAMDPELRQKIEPPEEKIDVGLSLFKKRKREESDQENDQESEPGKKPKIQLVKDSG